MGLKNNTKVLVTRDPDHCKDLTDAIIELGLTPICQPLFTIESTLDHKRITEICAKAQSAFMGIFVSRNAVAAIAADLDFAAGCKIAAIGLATARHLESFGASNVIYPSTQIANSKSLLAQIDALGCPLKSKYLMIFTGEGGDLSLFEALQARGASSELVTVYRRVIPTTLQVESDVEVTLITCVTSLHSLHKHCDNKDRLLLVVSERIKRVALEMGYSRVYTTNSMDTTDVISALRRVI